MHINVAIVTANMGSFDPPSIICDQVLPPDVGLSIFRFDDENFKPRTKSMTSRLQARIPKMFGWEMAPGFDYYIWVDGSFSILNPNTVAWYLDKINSYDAVFFSHPDRHTIKEEAEFIRKKIKDGNAYLVSRYENELIDEQLNACFSDPRFKDNNLFATCSFMYKNNREMVSMLKEWWIHTSRYHVVDQLSIPYIASFYNVNILKDDIYHIPYLTYTRNKKGG